MVIQSGTVTPGSAILASEYNDLRTDVLTPSVIQGTISSAGSITLAGENNPHGILFVDTEAGTAATDNLDGIDPGNFPVGGVLWLRQSTASRNVLVRDTNVGGGNIRLGGGDQIWLDDVRDTTGLMHLGSDIWQQIPSYQATTEDIEDLAVTAAKIANNAVDDTKAGNRVPQVYRRQGGDANDWAYVGDTDYTPGAVRIQCGYNATAGSASKVINFPVAFSYDPLVFVTVTAAAPRLVRRGAVYPGSVVITITDSGI
jgi:hypothetical protein